MLTHSLPLVRPAAAFGFAELLSRFPKRLNPNSAVAGATGTVAQAFEPAGSGDFPVARCRNTGQECPVNPQTRMSALHTVAAASQFQLRTSGLSLPIQCREGRLRQIRRAHQEAVALPRATAFVEDLHDEALTAMEPHCFNADRGLGLLPSLEVGPGCALPHPPKTFRIQHKAAWYTRVDRRADLGVRTLVPRSD